MRKRPFYQSTQFYVFLCNRQLQCHIHNSPTADTILSQLNQFRILTPYLPLQISSFFFTQLQDPGKSNIQLHLWHAYFITPVDDDLPAGCCRMYLGAFCVPSQYYVTYVHSFYLFFQFSNDFLLQVYAVVCHRRTWTRNKDLSFADLTLCWCQHFNFQLMHTTLKIVELLKYFKIRKTAPTCFGLQGNHHQAATVST